VAGADLLDRVFTSGGLCLNSLAITDNGSAYKSTNYRLNLAKYLAYFTRKYKYNIRLNYVHWRRK